METIQTATESMTAASRSYGEEEVLWGKAFKWEIKGAGEDEVWEVTGDFLGVARWATSLVESCELIEGEAHKPGCVRRVLVYPQAPGEASTFALEKLLEMDALHHRYSYTILGGSTLPGFSLMQDYVSTFKLSSLRLVYPSAEIDQENGTLLHWSFVCRPVSTLSEEETHNIAFSLYQAAVNDLKARLSLSDDRITLIS
eukprot:c18936_g1_i1 orf=372-968(+)